MKKIDKKTPIHRDFDEISDEKLTKIIQRGINLARQNLIQKGILKEKDKKE